MADIVEKTIKAGELPRQLRQGLDPETPVLVSVRPLTENGFTDEFEEGVLRAETETEATPFRPARDVIAELQALAQDEP